MKASESTLEEIIQGERQFVVPLFQRTYSWEKPEWETIWNDLLELYENPSAKNHFFGSIVTIQTNSVLQSIPKYLLVDGQQRLTTVFIILALLRDETEDKKSSGWIHEVLLVNHHRENEDFFKLQPVQIEDRGAFSVIINKSSHIEGNGITSCYHFFKNKLSRKKLDLKILSNVIAKRLSIVSIMLDEDDNPYLVFEGLNGKGLPLTQADFVRNHLFMRIDSKLQNEIYEKYWSPMQKNLNDNLSEFIRHYLIMVNSATINKNDVYSYLKDHIAKKDALEVLKEITIFSSYYARIINPTSHEKENPIRQALQRLNRLEITTVYPFLLNCYEYYATKKLTFDEFLRILHIIENFTIRRAICGITKKASHAIFPNLFRSITLKNPDNFVKGLCNILQTKGYPSDEDFKDQLINSDLYSSNTGRRNKTYLTKLLLECLEYSYGHKEVVNVEQLTIEHIMPQTILNNSWWCNHLGEDWQTHHDSYLHTLGNLTLTGYNSELSNSPFPDKKERLLNSHLEMNRYFGNCMQWKSEDIEQRANILAEQILGVWSYFGDENITIKNVSEVTKTKPRLLKIFEKEHHVKSWRELLIKASEVIAQLEPTLFERLVDNFPSFIHRTQTRCRIPHKLPNGFFIETQRNARDIYHFCLKIFESAGLSREDWKIDYA